MKPTLKTVLVSVTYLRLIYNLDNRGRNEIRMWLAERTK